MKINTKKRLYRSRKDKRIAGVCGGIADYLAIDPTLVRILWVLLALAGGPGVLLYIIMAVVIPEEPEFLQATAEKPRTRVMSDRSPAKNQSKTKRTGQINPVKTCLMLLG